MSGDILDSVKASGIPLTVKTHTHNCYLSFCASEVMFLCVFVCPAGRVLPCYGKDEED